MRKLQRWSTEMRRNLEYLLKQGYGSAEICEKLVVSTTALYKELARGLSEEEFKEKRYVPYSAELATYSLAIKDLDPEGIEILRKYINAKK